MSLFQTIPSGDSSGDRTRPLADRMRPRTLEEFVGQEHLLGPGKPLRLAIERDDTGSMIFWGPPGTGKTTLAKIIAASPTPTSSSSPPSCPASRRSSRSWPTPEGRGIRHAHHPLHRRDPSLQQGPAGRLPALRREGQHPPDRRDHRESFLRAQSPRCSRAAASMCSSRSPKSRSCCCSSARSPTTTRGLGATEAASVR